MAAAEPMDLSTHATPSLMSKRARQIQADAGLVPGASYRHAGIANDSDPIITATGFDRVGKGRARAGTLPSSWGDSIPILQMSPTTQESQSRFDAQVGNQVPTHASTRFMDLSSDQQHTSQPHESSPLDPSRFSSAPTSSQRIRSGSLTLPSANLDNAFGPSFFSSNWQPTRSGLSNMTSNDDETSFVSTTVDDPTARYSFNASDTLDYLGLADTSVRSSRNTLEPPLDSLHPRMSHPDALLTNSQMRNRALTLSAQQYRPKLGAGDGRARSSSFLPSFRLDTVEDVSRDMHESPTSRNGSLSGSHSPYQTGALQLSLFTAALHNRLSQYGAISIGKSADQISSHTSGGARPRATSMGILDQNQSRGLSEGHRQDQSQAQGLAMDEVHHTINLHKSAPNDLPVYTANSDSQTDLASLLSSGRHRAGTLAAFPGPGGRQRTEQELLRMTQMPLEISAMKPRQSRPSSSGTLELGAHTDSFASRSGLKNFGSASGTSSPFSQPTRAIWLGHLRPNVTGQDLLTIFSRYGAVETYRLIPDKGCAFINFVDINDAIKAKDDISNRLAGRIGLAAGGVDSQVRVGFGKPDSVPPSSLGGNSSMHDSAFGLSETGPSDATGSWYGELTNPEPSRALWVGSIPPMTPTETLVSIFAPFGPIESVRVLSNKSCAFINFERLDDAILARKALNGRDMLGPEIGPVKIGFAKVPNKVTDGFVSSLGPSISEWQTAMESLSSLHSAGSIPLEAQLSKGLENYRSDPVIETLSRQSSQTTTPASHVTLSRNLSSDTPRFPPNTTARSSAFPTHSSSNSIVPSSDKGGVPLPMKMKPRVSVMDLQLFMRQLDGLDPNVSEDMELVARSRPLTTYYAKIPPVSEMPPGKKIDSSRLKDVRKRVENPSCSHAEADALAHEFLPSIVELSSDFIGNTLVQKFFEKCSESTKGAMLELIAPHLAIIGVHKNGTWAAQKIIDCTLAADQRDMIAQHLRPYIPPLLMDQFGNYVVQRLIPFGSPYVDLIFDAMFDRCWEIAQGRFGSRSMRACLESPELPRSQVKRVAIAIILNSVPLATSQNGALLMTWLLDASTLPGRFRLLAPRLVPHLASLCTHKLASQTVHRVVSQKTDLEASRQILQIIFNAERPQLLEEILVDQVHGSQFITRIMVDSTLLDSAQREQFSEEIRKMLLRHNLVHTPPYRPLSISLGLLTPNTGLPLFAAAYEGSRDLIDLDRQLSSMSLGNARTPSHAFEPTAPSLSFGAYDAVGMGAMRPSPLESTAAFANHGVDLASSAFDPWASEGAARVQDNEPSFDSFATSRIAPFSSQALPARPGLNHDFPFTPFHHAGIPQQGLARKNSPLNHASEPRFS